MKTTIPVKIFLEDLYKNGLEPERGEQVYKINCSVSTESHRNAFGSHQSHSVKSEHVEYAKYYGNPSIEDWVGDHIAKKKDSGYYNKVFLSDPKKSYNQLWIHNCYVLRNIEI